jgi:hypothetical protein
MLRDYREYFPMKYSQIGDTSFKKVVKAHTTQDQKARKAVDYVSGRLMYDNFDLIGKILSQSDDADDLKILTNSLEAFLKSSFEDHIFKCRATNPEFAFAEQNSTEKEKFTTCTLSQVVMQYLKDPPKQCIMNCLMNVNRSWHCIKVTGSVWQIKGR